MRRNEEAWEPCFRFHWHDTIKIFIFCFEKCPGELAQWFYSTYEVLLHIRGEQVLNLMWNLILN